MIVCLLWWINLALDFGKGAIEKIQEDNEKKK